VLKPGGGGFILGAGVSRELTEALCQASGRPVMSSLGVTTDQHGQPMDNYKEQMQWLEDTNQRGNRVFAQLITAEVGFEFTLEDWNLFDSSPHWRDITLGDVPTRIAKMSDPERRTALREEFDAGKGPIAGGGTEERVGGVNVWGVASMIVESVEKDELRDCEGLTIAEVAERTEKHPIDAMLDLAVADDLQTTFVTPPRERSEGEMEAIKEVCNSSFALPGVSDGGAHTKFITLGAYTTEYLTKLVRDEGVMDLEQAHWRLSAYPAMAAGFLDRGWIREGAPADIVVYDYENLALQPQEKAFDFPADEWRRVRKATGYRWTLVNGEVTFEEGECTGATPGKVLRHGSA
ncbi:MAG: amidohydrolase family protein, partial [Dehalococcoidia bacterium]|nr:amidohydrolase family protein [Dehalococcoidia bacterium]